MRSFKNDSQNYGEVQLEWFKHELQQAEKDPEVQLVVVVHSWPWFTLREFKSKKDKKNTELKQKER